MKQVSFEKGDGNSIGVVFADDISEGRQGIILIILHSVLIFLIHLNTLSDRVFAISVEEFADMLKKIVFRSVLSQNTEYIQNKCRN